jgi:CelD/BcsL family acetyltransferase involved in cellulose biosynthesis
MRSDDGMRWSTQIITRRADLEPLSAEWNGLLASSRADCIFLTWEWIATWLDCVHPSARLMVVAARDGDGRLVGVAPFYRTRLRLLRVLDYPTLRILGDQQSGAEYGDVVVAPAAGAACVSAILDALARTRGWQCLWLPNLAGWTGAVDVLRAACVAAGLRLHERARDFAAIRLPNSYDDYLAALSGNARSTLRRQARRMEQAGCELVRCETRTQLDELLAALFDLHRQRWSQAGQLGSFVRKPLLRRFYEHFAPLALARGWLRLYGLRCGKHLAAVQYGYAYGGRFYQLQEGFDPDAPDGAGNVLRSRVVEACIREGLEEYDGLGGYTEHKRRWLAQPRTGYDLLIGRPTLRNRLLFHRPVWPTGRYLRPCAIPSPDTTTAPARRAAAAQGALPVAARDARGGAR